MTEKEFVLQGVAYTVCISHFDEGCPGKLSGPPEDCYQEESPEVEFAPTVKFKTSRITNEIKLLDFDDFVKLYAAEYTEGDIEKAENRINDETIESILEDAAEYEP